MALINGATYRLQSRADSSRSLNVYGTKPASLANVCLFRNDNNDICQQWVYKKSGTREYFVCKGNQNLALDLYTGSSSTNNVKNYNAHAYAPSETSYVKVDDTISGGYIRIKLDYNGNYLTANPGSDGSSNGKDTKADGNVYFYSGTVTNQKQHWKPIRLDGGTPDPGPSIGQKLILPLNRTKLTASYKNETYKKKYGFTHYGIDQVSSVGNTTIYASGTGTLIAKGWDELAGNVVVIKYPNAYHHTTGKYEDVILRYFHLASINTNIPTGTNQITKDTILGQYGGSGMGEQNHWSAHLHVEADTDTTSPCYSPTFSGSGSIIKGANSGATDSTCHSVLEYLHCKTTAPDNQSYTTVGDAYINFGDESIPKL